MNGFVIHFQKRYTNWPNHQKQSKAKRLSQRGIQGNSVIIPYVQSSFIIKCKAQQEKTFRAKVQPHMKLKPIGLHYGFII